MSNPTITIITTPNGGHRWIANSDEEVAHFSLPGQGHKIEIYTRVAPTEAAAMAATVPAEVADALHWVDDFIARCNGDDRGACESVNIIRRALAQQAPVADQPAGDDLQLLLDAARSDGYHTAMGEVAARAQAVADQPAEPSPADHRISIHFHRVADGLPEAKHYNSSYGGAWLSDWCVVLDADGYATSSRWTVTDGEKQFVDQGCKPSTIWRMGSGRERVVAWAYKDDVLKALAATKGDSNG